MNNNFNEIYDRKNTNSVKWDLSKEQFNKDDIIPMWIADMDFQAPKEVTDALIKKAEHGIFGYTFRPDSYFDSIINWNKKRHNFDIKKEWIIHSNGVVPALSVAIQTFSNIGDKIIIQPPVYHPFHSVIKNNEREILFNNLKYENGHYTMDFDDLEKQIDKKTKMIIISSPHNPVGRVWSLDEIKKLGEICLEHNIIMVSDEIHSDITLSGNKHIPTASISEELAQITITCMAPSKTFNIAGLSTSYIVIKNENLRNKLKSTMDNLEISSGNLFGMTALEVAYTKGENWLNDVNEYLENSFDYMVDYVNKNIKEIKITKPEGTYLGWLDCRGLGMNSKDLNEFMINQAKVGLNDGSMFGETGEGFMRINIGCPRSTLVKALEQIKEAVDNI